MQTDFVFELMNLEVREFTAYLKGGQVHHDFQDWATTFALRVQAPDLCGHGSSDGSDDRSGIPFVVVQKS